MMELFSKCYDCLRRRRKDRASQDGEDEEEDGTSWNLFFPLQVLQIATNFFSELNQLGHGGFGPVYKGLLPNGQEIAVKRLALNSRQGLREFTNEVKLLLKIQHKNLVTLFGCCVDGPEKMLVYEYLHNKSLDCFLFDKSKSGSLSWSIRYEIIIGIARGLLYLHEEAPVRIIHRDIKASNILLDEQLKPKISDFGLARLFPGDGTHLNTFKIAGTHGYMAPEYAMRGYLSAKADVFSFGVLLLEIVSGRKNYDEKLDSGKTDLLSYTWKNFCTQQQHGWMQAQGEKQVDDTSYWDEQTEEFYPDGGEDFDLPTPNLQALEEEVQSSSQSEPWVQTVQGLLGMHKQRQVDYQAQMIAYKQQQLAFNQQEQDILQAYKKQALVFKQQQDDLWQKQQLYKLSSKRGKLVDKHS